MPTKQNKKQPMRWRNIILGILIVGLTVGILHLMDTMIYGRSIHYREEEAAFLLLPPELDGYTLALITDTHSLSEAELEQMRQKIIDRQVDLVLLGGDYQKSIETVPRILGTIPCPDGVVAVEGNHDITEEWVRAFEKYDVPMLYNSGKQLRPGLYIGGTADLWSGNSDVAAALAEKNKEDFTLLLAHNPDTAMDTNAAGADLVLSGHTHGGHATFFGLWKPLLRNVTKYGYRFGGGWSKGYEDIPVYVSKGAGYYRNWMTPRVYSHPEIVFVTLRGAQG